MLFKIKGQEMERDYLLSYHGLFLEYDADIGIYEQSIISSVKNHDRFLCLDSEKKEVLSFFKVLNIEHDGQFVSIGCDNSYITSLPDGQLVLQDIECIQAWERFFRVPEDFFCKLRHISTHNWKMGQETVRKRDIYISENYMIKLGPYNLGIHDFIMGLRFDFSNPEHFCFSDNGHEISCALLADIDIPSTIWVNSLGNIANRALQYLVARNMQDRSRNIIIRNVDLPEWGMQKETADQELQNACMIGELDFWFDIDGMSENLATGNIDHFIMNGYPFNVDFYPGRENSRKYLPGFSDLSESTQGFGEGEIVFNIRANEVLHGIHGDYLVLPVEYYKMLEEKSGLKPVFFGQLADNPYIEKLHKAFPHARFVNGQGARHDFEVLRKSCHIAISVSTFSWLAAWLSNASSIYLPLAGMMNPCQAIGQNFIPRNDPSYKFVSFPLCRSECLYRHPDRFWKSLDYMAQNMKFISRHEARDIFTRIDMSRNHKQALGGFDPRFYMKKNYNEVFTPGMALSHYMESDGKIQDAFPIKERDYIVRYPRSGIMVANGYFKSVNEYHSFVGNYIGNINY